MNVDDMRLDELVATDRELADRGLRWYIELAWKCVEPARPYVDNWHIAAMAEHLEAVAPLNQIDRLIINVPPGHMKSLIVNVFWPSWLWRKKAELTFMFASYAANLSTRDSLKMRALIEAPWYKRRWPELVVAQDQKDTQTKYSTNKGGFRLATSVDGQATGEHVDVQAVDDALKAADAHHKTKRENVITWWDQTMASRVRKGGKRVVVMQRLHQGDLCGVLMQRGGYEHLCLPEEYEPTKRKTSIGFADPRAKQGDLLWPALFPKEMHEARVREFGAYGAAGQLQQRPAPAGGGIIREEWFKYYNATTMPAFERVEIVVDANFDAGATNSYVAIGVFGEAKRKSYLLHVIRRRMGYVDTKQAIRDMLTKGFDCAYGRVEPGVVRCLRIEKKANGSALVDELRREFSIVTTFMPHESKEARAYAASPQVEAGNLLLPEEAPWLGEYMLEVTTFPSAENDDQVDMTTMHLLSKQTFRTEFVLAESEDGEDELDDESGYVGGYDSQGSHG